MACLRRNNQNRFFKFRNSRISFCGYDGSYQRFPAVFAADAQHYSRRRDVKLEKLRAQTHCANRAELLFCRAAAFLCLRTSDRGICNNGGRLKGSFCPPDLTQTLWVNTYIATPLDVVLWTVAIEVWFYVLFPFVAEFIKGPRNKNRQSFTPAYGIFFIFAVFNIINYVYTENFVLKGNVYLAMRINQFPAFLGVYSIGMLGASAFVLIAKNCRRSRIFNAVNTLFSVCSILLIIYLINDCVATQERQVWQVTERSKLAFVFMTFIITTALSSKWYRWLFSNKFMRFLSGISYNLYIWHQWLAVQCKNTWRIPKWSGEIPPNMLNITYWMNRYAVVITVFAFAAAILATYLIEKPFANLIMGRPVFPLFAKKHLKTANSADEECISEEESAPLSAEVDSFADNVDSDEPTEDAAANPWGEQETDRNDSDCD